jgi:hypothetical protein
MPSAFNASAALISSLAIAQLPAEGSIPESPLNFRLREAPPSLSLDAFGTHSLITTPVRFVTFTDQRVSSLPRPAEISHQHAELLEAQVLEAWSYVTNNSPALVRTSARILILGILLDVSALPPAERIKELGSTSEFIDESTYLISNQRSRPLTAASLLLPARTFALAAGAPFGADSELVLMGKAYSRATVLWGLCLLQATNQQRTDEQGAKETGQGTFTTALRLLRQQISDWKQVKGPGALQVNYLDLYGADPSLGRGYFGYLDRYVEIVERALKSLPTDGRPNTLDRNSK